MPLVRPHNAFREIYTGITKNQWSLQDDGAGIFVSWIDEAIEPLPENYPTLAELEAAEIAYVEPANEVDDRASSGLNWKGFLRRLLENTNANSPYRQLQAWGLEAGSGRYNHTLTEIATLAGVLNSASQLRVVLADLKVNLVADSFTVAQRNEIDNLLGILGVSWVWADL